MKESRFSLGNFSLDMLVELLKANGLVIVATHSVNNVQKFKLTVAVVQLVVDLLHVLEVNFSLSLVVNEVESLSATLVREGVSLNY